MSESAPRDEATVEQEIEGLERAVGALLDELTSLRRRAESAEARHERLEQTLRQSRLDGADPEALERRLRELGDENARLNAVIEEARQRAGRIRSRLLVIEDEASD
jgi:predicted RNase H-like nuclease (RuvC/YqgF family)